MGFLGSSADKESTCDAGDPGVTPGSGSSPGEGVDYPLQNICKLKNRAMQLLKTKAGTSLAVQWLRFWVSDAWDAGLLTDQGTKIYVLCSSVKNK